MCNEAADDCLVALKFILDWFDTSKSNKKLLTGLYADDNILYFNEGSGDVIFFCNEMGILSIDLNNINLHDNNYGEDEPETIIHVRLLACHSLSENHKALQKS